MLCREAILVEPIDITYLDIDSVVITPNTELSGSNLLFLIYTPTGG